MYMLRTDRPGRRIRAAGAALLAAPLCLFALAPSLALAEEIIVTISRVRALEKIDQASQADFFAKVTIAGETLTAGPAQDQDDARPNWVLRKRVNPGVHSVKLEVWDKDVAKDDQIDINRIVGKKDLDFQVDTGNCSIQGFSTPYRCGAAIVRAGTESKKAEVTFSVNVAR